MKFYKAVALLSFAAALVGCAQTVKEGAAPGIHVEDELVKVRMNSVAVLDRELQVTYVNQNNLTGSMEYGHASKISVESSGARRTPTGTVEVYTVLRNRTNYPQQLECNVQFFDRNAIPVEGPTAWQRVLLAPNSVASYKELSTTSEGSNYYIQVREGR